MPKNAGEAKTSIFLEESGDKESMVRRDERNTSSSVNGPTRKFRTPASVPSGARKRERVKCD